MRRSTIRIIILLATVLLIGLIAMQAFWVNKAYQLTELQLDHDITIALKNVANQIIEHSDDSAQVADPVKEVSPYFYTVSINDTLHPYYLQSLLKNEFIKQEINIDFEYSIYDCFTDSVVYRHQVINPNDQAEEVTSSAPQVKWDRDGHYFSVFFPTINTHLLKRLDFWFLSSGLLLIVAIFFAYTISIILKQKRLSEIKTDFINNMTHELKTPISTISLSADVLLKPETSKEPERLINYARIIKNENTRLQNQVERVLQMATLDKEEIQLNIREVDINEIVKNAVPTIELNVKEKQGKVDLQMNAENSVVQADVVHLTNIIYNLLDNANKYTQKPPEIIVRTANTSRGVSIEIKDNGIGIAKEHQKQVFDKFYRVPKGNVHDVKGFGLGLHYVKTIAEAHQGSISIDSELGKGSTFTLFLPFIHKSKSQQRNEGQNKDIVG